MKINLNIVIIMKSSCGFTYFPLAVTPYELQSAFNRTLETKRRNKMRGHRFGQTEINQTKSLMVLVPSMVEEYVKYVIQDETTTPSKNNERHREGRSLGGYPPSEYKSLHRIISYENNLV